MRERKFGFQAAASRQLTSRRSSSRLAWLVLCSPRVKRPGDSVPSARLSSLPGPATKRRWKRRGDDDRWTASCDKREAGGEGYRGS